MRPRKIRGKTASHPVPHQSEHRTERIGWLRPAVLGANDGIVSTASLLLGVATAQASHSGILIAGVAGLVSGAMSMAAGEYVSVRSQTDVEEAETEIERKHIAANPEYETQELAAIYVERGLDSTLADKVARQLMARDALGAHVRDELGFSDTLQPKPIQAAVTSALSFATGAALPLLTAALVPQDNLIPLVATTSLLFLAFLGGLAARAGGAPVINGAMRVTFWSALAMAFTAGVGLLFHVTT
jgi:VIT1/CCC1 family predicted Fe2+/Mn2+ transporter